MSTAALFAFVGAGCAGALAAAGAARAGRSIARWAFAAGMTVLAVESVLAGLSASAGLAADAREWQIWRFVALSFLPPTWLAFSATYARGNSTQALLRHRGPLLLSGLLPVVFFWQRDGFFATPDPDADAVHLFRLGGAGIALASIVLVAAVWIVMNLERTFRASVGTIRWRIKFMLLGVGVLFVARIYTSSQILVFRGLNAALDSIDSGALIVATLLILRSFFRAGHFDLDVYPSQSVLQKSVTVLVAGVYLLIIGALAKAVTYFGGDGAFALKAFLVLIALVALAVVLQSDHARLQLRKFVSRHFQRPLYDYRTVWQKFTDATASRVEPIDLSRAIAALVADVFQALSVSVWLVNDNKDTLALAASTSTAGSGQAGGKSAAFPAVDAIAYLQFHPEPVDIEGSRHPWAAGLRNHHPDVFPNGGHRACVPLINHGELIGVIIMGDRVGGMPLTQQDFDMLKRIADHAAASLVNIQLSQKLMRARELEAFQAMAAFFVHDLKNAASTLNLTLQNLPVHFDNPEFRADALRGIAKTVAHINRLIGRLSALRHELKIELADADLNEVVNHVLASLEHAAGPTLVKEIQPLPRIPLDREQLNKVITNLVLNAAEASPRDGRVRIATGQENGWVVLTVDDNGCGMSDEFLHHALFRPFQTTKQNGLGIGMFQSKMIVEAHGGRIAVASQPGKGTTFQVFLRAPEPARAN
jgi:putative PEP-CTERM system histidine kinase